MAGRAVFEAPKNYGICELIDDALGLKAGDVFIWDNYPLAMVQQKDRRWFILLGTQSIEQVVYEVTTTTQMLYYEPEGIRCKNNFFRIQAGIGGLIADSVVDFTQYFEQIPEKLINENKTNIHKQGTLPQTTINTLVKHIKNAKNISQMVKKDIYRCLRVSGFTVNVK
jgi:hypothetical protein